MTKGYVGWALPDAERAELLGRFPPRYERVVGHHCTLIYGVDDTHPLPTDRVGEVVGVADDQAGVQALVLKIGGTTDRPGGSTYHITWSLAANRKPKESNDVIRANGWSTVFPAVSVHLEPKFFPMGGAKS